MQTGRDHTQNQPRRRYCAIAVNRCKWYSGAILALLMFATACTPTQSGGEGSWIHRAEFAPSNHGTNGFADNAPGYMHITWIDSRASRNEYFYSGYVEWDVRVGLGFRLRDDARERLKHRANFIIAAGFSLGPRHHVEVQHIDGRPVDIALDYFDAYGRIVFPNPGGLAAWRLLNQDEEWSTHVASTWIGLGEKPEPGIYRMRLKADSWGDAEGMVIDDSWHTFIITEVGDKPTSLDDLPWYDLPESPREDD